MKKIIGMSLLAISVLVTSTVYADVVHLKSGRKMEGKIIKEEKNRITLKTDYGTVGFKRGDILSIERKPYVFKKKKAPPKKKPKKRQPILGKLISINFTDAPMSAVFDFFSELTRREVRYDGDIEDLGVITIRANDVSFKEAMEKIARQKGLKCEIKENSVIFSRP